MNTCTDCNTPLPMDRTQQIDLTTGQAQCIPCCLACPPGTAHSDLCCCLDCLPEALTDAVELWSYEQQGE